MDNQLIFFWVDNIFEVSIFPAGGGWVAHIDHPALLGTEVIQPCSTFGECRDKVAEYIKRAYESGAIKSNELD